MVRQFAYQPEAIAAELGRYRHAWLFGRPGVGKSTLAAQIAAALAAQGQACTCLGADPGSPAFGLPGAVCLGRWTAGGWRRIDFEPLCSLDPGRFRLPLVAAVRRLLARASPDRLLIDGPGVVRGIAAAELFDGIVRLADIHLVVALEHDGRALPLADELSSLDIDVWRVVAHAAAHPMSKQARARARTALWDHYLEGAAPVSLDLRTFQCTGTSPPIDAAAAWVGRQTALLKGRRCVAFGEVIHVDGGLARMRLVGDAGDADRLLTRGARRAADGLLRTAPGFASGIVGFVPPPDAVPPIAGPGIGPRPVARVGPVTATLVNGVFGDPLLHLRFRHRRRSLLFDLGEGARLSARLAHQVTDVFLSHAHVDHIAGFIWLLRSRIGETSICRIFGPPGIAANIGSLIAGVHWDRIGDRGPRFEVAELHGDRLRRHDIQAGQAGRREPDDAPVVDGVLIREPDFAVRAVTLDHGTPVLAFSLEPELDIKVRKERLREAGLEPGPWLTELKAQVAAARHQARIELPDGRRLSAGELADRLVLIRTGEKLVYATDLADLPANRDRLCGLARGAHTLFCEAVFCEADADQAARTGHLTARACGEIAARAGVRHLMPFHFSRRYEDDPGRVYAEVKAACASAVIPPDFAAQ